MGFKLELTEKDRATNAVFQIKALLLQLQSNTKPQLANAIALIKNGGEGLSKEAMVAAMGDSGQEILERLEAINASL